MKKILAFEEHISFLSDRRKSKFSSPPWKLCEELNKEPMEMEHFQFPRRTSPFNNEQKCPFVWPANSLGVGGQM